MRVFPAAGWGHGDCSHCCVQEPRGILQPLSLLLMCCSCASDDGLSPGCHHGGPRRVLLLGWHQAEEIPRHGLPRCHGQELGKPESVFQVRDGALGQQIMLLGLLCFTNTLDLCFHAVRRTKLKWPKESPVQCKTKALSINSFHT